MPQHQRGQRQPCSIFSIACVLLWVVGMLDKCQSYDWFSQVSYGISTCSNSSVNNILLEEMNKCYQESSSSSTRSTCALTPDDAFVTKTVVTWSTGDCTGKTATNTTSRISTSCIGGITFGCITGEKAATVETWPGIGTWQSTAADGLGQSCSYKCGPQFVEAFPPACMNNGLVSWEYSCLDTTLSYDFYKSANCTPSTKLTDESTSYKTGECFDFEDQRGYAACSISAIPGTSFLSFSDNSPEGNVESDSMSSGITAAIVIIVLFVAMGVGVGGIWFVRRYDMTVRLKNNERKQGALADDVEMADFDNKSVTRQEPGDPDNPDRDLSVSDNQGDVRTKHQHEAPSALYQIMTCKCCYDEYQ